MNSQVEIRLNEFRLKISDPLIPDSCGALSLTEPLVVPILVKVQPL